MKLRERATIAAWWALAQSDLYVARLLLSAELSQWHQVCFHSQQAAEKAIKAVLEAEELPIVRTHDLVLLVRTLVVRQPTATELVPAALALSEYAVLPRYPLVQGPASAEDAHAAVASAEVVVTWCAARLDAEVPEPATG